MIICCWKFQEARKNLTPMLRTTHKLTAISNPTPLLLKARDSSKMMPAYPIPNSNAIATSYFTKFDQISQVTTQAPLYHFFP
jgi:hypothetical protein